MSIQLESIGGKLYINGFEVLTAGSPMSNPNLLINGGMDIWQRGVSFALTALTTFASDRWNFVDDGIDAVVTKEETNVDIWQNKVFAKFKLGTTAASSFMSQKLEPNTILTGKEYTLSGKLRQFEGNGSGKVIEIILRTVEGETYPAEHRITVDIPIITGTAWAEYNIGTFLAPTSGPTTEAWDIVVKYEGEGSMIDIMDFKLEEGSVATPYQARPIGEELLLCQRYYQTLHDIYVCQNGSVRRSFTPYPVQMRVSPVVSFIDYDGNGVVEGVNSDRIGVRFDSDRSHTDPLLTIAQGIKADAEL